MSAAQSALDEKDVKGAFVRTGSTFRDVISADHPTFKPEAGRYHLVVSHACPWANRVVAVRALKGLEDTISLSVVHPTWQSTSQTDSHCGWAFEPSPGAALKSPSGMGSFVVKDCAPLPGDVATGAASVRDVYAKCSTASTKFTVPFLWDRKTNTIVNNESSELIDMLNGAFDDFAANAGLDLDPAEFQAMRADMDPWIYNDVNNGVYRCGFAQTQEAYDEAVSSLYGALDRLEGMLATKRYLCGSTLTLSDVRLFMTLVRFDEVYVVYFKCNKKRIADYPHLRAYCRDVYQTPKMAGTIHMDHIKTHYFTSHPTLNHFAVIPAGPDVLADLALPHGREAM
ncbi:glutathione S-transferase [Pelagophyceae sp. CCMP2097]|nr:glutathione S-transferase [Pelagophyceae sp. CCMP2097]